MRKKKSIGGVTILLTVVILWTTGCERFLDEKSDASLSIPETFIDLRALMNNEGQMNRYFPALTEMGSDDYYVKSNILQARAEPEQLIYTWTSNLQRSDEQSWRSPYNTIMMTNIVLESLDRIEDGSKEERDILHGEALFVRAYAFFYLAQIFCPPYDPDTGSSLLGLPLRTSSDFSVHFERASLDDTYNFMINDLKRSLDLLPEHVQFKSRPSKAAALAALSKIYLLMGKYEDANSYAEDALSFNNSLMDYNSLDKDLRIPFPIAHDEVIYYALCSGGYLIANNRAFIPKSLYDSYADNDLRKVLFFNLSDNGDVLFKGNYDGVGGTYFAGLATDELYLIRAECEIRADRIDEGLDFLNALLDRRYETGTFDGYNAVAKEQALDLVLLERRKQLVKRGIRWTDLRRLLKEDGRVGVLYRKADNGVDDEAYRLEPHVNNYVYPIPPTVARLGGYKQNLQ